MASSLLLSFELIYFLGWLFKNEKKTLDSLIKQSVNKKFRAELDTINLAEGMRVNDEIYDNFIEFIEYMENTLIDKIDGKGKKTVRKKLSSSLNHLNSKLNSIDDQTIWLAMKQAETELSQDKSKQTSNETRKLLLGKILKNWNPSQEEEVN